MEENTERVSLEYTNFSQKYTQQNADFHKQYYHVYLARLRGMESLLKERIDSKWGAKYPICKLYKLSEEKRDKCVVIGTLFKDQKLKPSVLKQLAEANQLVPQPIVHHFTDESDVLFIEDELQRYQLMGPLKPDNLVTGISCALLGTDIGNGKFMVEDFIFPDYRDQVERPILNDDVYIVFLSGLDFVNHANFATNLDLFCYWISGMLGNINEDVSKVARIIIAGNSTRRTPPKLKPTISMISKVTESADTIDAVKSFDNFLLNLCEVIEVDVMPGENDPSNRILPQKPMHYCMFPKSAAYKSLNNVPNPYCCSIGGVKILGSSGQPVRDINWYSEVADPLDALECCLMWNHIAPTAPDTLGCYPFYDKDPFIIDDCPHVFFAGNQKEFATKEVKGYKGQIVQLISIPEFSQTFEAVILNLKNYDCYPMLFKTHK